MKPQTQNAVEILALLPHLTTPRPNGSRAQAETVAAVRAWLEERGISLHSQPFTLLPYFMELLGLWLALGGILLLVAALAHGTWLGLGLAILLVAVPVLEIHFLRPTISALVRRSAENLVAHFPAPDPCREIILCAHLDSKTELLDHARRAVLLRLGRPAIGLALVCGVLVTLEPFTSTEGMRLVTHSLGLLTALPVAIYGLGMGANLTGGRFSPHPSPGAVDNGAAVAVLLDLAERLHHGSLPLDHMSVTLLFTVGEEAQMQGALAYVRDRKAWALPVRVVNLEIVGQNGSFLLWDADGTAMRRLPTDLDLNNALTRAIQAATGEQIVRAPLVNSDAFAFLRQGISATTLGSLDIELGERGLHSVLDSPDRVDPARLITTVEVLSHLLQDLEGITKENVDARPHP